MSSKPILLYLALGLLGLAMLAGVVGLLSPGRFIDQRIMGTILLVGCYSMGAIVLGALVRRGRIVARIGIVCLLISLGVYLLTIWTSGRTLGYTLSEALEKLALVLLIATVWCFHRLLIAPMPLTNAMGNFMRRTALVTAVLCGLLLIVAIVFDDVFLYTKYGSQIIGLGLIVTAGATIGAGLYFALGPRLGEDEPGLLGETIGVHLRCPRCDAPIEAKSNRETRCDGCRLKVRVEVEEPRCACGYLLYQLAGDTCPECGRPVSEEDRWDNQCSTLPA